MALVTGCVGWGVKLLAQISSSISDLNSKITGIIEKMNWHEKALNSYENRIRGLEMKLFDSR